METKRGLETDPEGRQDLFKDSRRGVTKSWGLEKGLDKYLNNKLVIGDQDLNKYLNDWESRSRFQVSHYKVCLQILFLQNQINSYRKTASKNYSKDNFHRDAYN